MTEEASEREKLVQAIMRRHQQPTLEDAVKVIKFDSIQSVSALLELDGALRKKWWERRDPGTWE